MQTSDYFLHDNVVITDTLGDGQHILQQLLHLLAIHLFLMVFQGHFLQVANITHHVHPEDTHNGDLCRLIFGLSDQLIVDGYSGTIPSGTTIEIRFENCCGQ